MTRERVIEHFKKHNYDFLPGVDPHTFQPFSGAKVLDIGANLGFVTAFWALNGANVTSYEADPETYRIMIDMFAEIGIDVNSINAAVWTHAGEVRFKGLSHMSSGGFCRNGALEIFEYAGDVIAVPCVTFAQALGDTVWDCVKMDIEGAEFEVLMSTPLEAMKGIKYMNLELHKDEYAPGHGWMMAAQVEALREKLEKIFIIHDSHFSPGFWHLEAKTNEK
jgi:FkbM family methyltransferase